MSVFVPECLEELQAAGSHPRCDDLCLTHHSTVERVSIQKEIRGERKKKRKKKKLMLFTFTCFAFLPAWARMTFHFLPRVISKGLIQFALQAVSNPLPLLDFSLRRMNTRTFAV